MMEILADSLGSALVTKYLSNYRAGIRSRRFCVKYFLEFYASGSRERKSYIIEVFGVIPCDSYPATNLDPKNRQLIVIMRGL